MTNTINTKRALCTAITAILAGTNLVAHAQKLEEVLVTAQKRTESLQDVPISVSALGAGEIERMRFNDSTEIAAQVPNLVSTNTLGNGFPIFSLRGVSMSDFSLNQSSPVASYVDEVYKGNPAIQGVQIFDLERIEVLRGPQGTLYGKNSTGGAVNYITRKPGYENTGHLSLGVGNFDRLEASGAAEIELIDEQLAARVAGVWREVDGWFENKQPGVDDANAIDEYGIRTTVLWQPTERTEFILRYTRSDQDAVNYGIQPTNISADGVGNGVYGLYNLLGATDKVDYTRQGRDFFEFDSDQDENHNQESDALSLTVNWEFSDRLTLTSITSWDDGDIFVPEDGDGSPLIVVRPYYEGDAEQWAQDLRITSDLDGPFNFIAGVYYAKEEVSNRTTIAFYNDLDMNIDGNLDFYDCLDPLLTAEGLGPVTDAGIATEAVLNDFGLSLGAFVPAGCQIQNDFDQDRTSYAGYLDGSYDFNDHWTLRAGLRFTSDKTELENFSARILGNDDVPLVNTIPGNPDDPFAKAPDDDFTDDEWTGKLGIDYTTNGGTLLYASYSHGYRSGAFNAQAFFDPSELTQVNPEKLDSFEIGFKSELLDGAMELSGAAFYYQYDDQQFLNVDPVTLAQTLINIEESEIIGAELEMRYAITDSVMLRAGLGYLDSEVQDGELNGVDLEGNDLLLAPELNFNAAVNWVVWSGPAGTIGLNLDTTYVDDHYFEIFNVDRLQEDGYWVSNGRLEFISASEAWQVAAWIKNIADEEYATSKVDLLSSFGYDYSHIGAPRTYGAEFTFRF